MSKWLLTVFEKNPLAWILAGLLALSVYSHFRTGAKFTEACTLFDALQQGYFETATPPNLSLDWEAIGKQATDHERLMAEDSREGREYRWRYRTKGDLEKICGSRLAPPEPSPDM
jgi:hypothetical protein